MEVLCVQLMVRSPYEFAESQVSILKCIKSVSYLVCKVNWCESDFLIKDMDQQGQRDSNFNKVTFGTFIMSLIAAIHFLEIALCWSRNRYRPEDYDSNLVSNGL